MLNKKENKDFWDNRAKRKRTKHYATSNDVSLRKLEIKRLILYLKQYKKKIVYDIGCGNGYNTFIFARKFKDKKFVGVDYSPGMIDTAQKSLRKQKLKNISFKVDDITRLDIKSSSVDIVLTSRVFINLQTYKNQIKAAKEVARVLKPGGKLIMLESVKQSYDNLNKLRKRYKLSKLVPHEINKYINENKFLDRIKNWFKVIKIDPFSSTYYLGSRIAYPLILGPKRKTKANHPVNEFFSLLEPIGDCGREKIYVLGKK